MAASVALLLHMHQPDYRDPTPGPRQGEPALPWVRLHACRGYLDVADRILAHGVDVTVNVAPSLLEQLAWYAAGGTDAWARLAAIPAEDLTSAQADFVRSRFVCGHPAMRSGSPRYQALAARAPVLDSSADLRDLQVWSNLAWMGPTARRHPTVADLIDQDQGFAHEQLLWLLHHQRALCAEVLALWRRLPSVSCSPHTHPILPLLIDFSSVRRALPLVPDEVDFRHPEDALRQLCEGRALVKEHLGREPQGLWPSEGSVSPELLPLAVAAGFRWLATDEAVLERSDRQGPLRITGSWETGGLRAVFRARELSDRIGFHYARWVPGPAVADLLAGADEIAAAQGGDTVPLILDGENPWESYPDAGVGFLDALFSSGRVTGVEAMAQTPVVGRIDRLHSGSWIGGDFGIWAGDVEDRAAWQRLAAARSAWEQAGRPEEAWPHLAAAEGSDWFWWFGPEFETPVADLFAALFTAHLDAVWRILGTEAEATLGVVGPVLPPTIDALSSGAPWHTLAIAAGGSQARAGAVLAFGAWAAAPDGLALGLGLRESTGRGEPEVWLCFAHSSAAVRVAGPQRAQSLESEWGFDDFRLRSEQGVVGVFYPMDTRSQTSVEVALEVRLGEQVVARQPERGWLRIVW